MDFLVDDFDEVEVPHFSSESSISAKVEDETFDQNIFKQNGEEKIKEENDEDELTFNDVEEEENEQEEINIPTIDLNDNELTNFKPYDYQLELYKISVEQNSIIFLDTGKGKTLIALMHVYHYIKKYGFEKTKLVFLANTIQLVEQQCIYFRENILKVAYYMENNGLAPQDNYFDLDNFKNQQFMKKFIIPIHSKSIGNEDEIDVQGWKRERWDEVVDESCVLIMMGQMLLNGLRRGYLQLPYFSLIIFDECHHCQHNHSYRMIISEFYEDEKIKKNFKNTEKVKFLGLTATPVTSVDIEKAAKIQRIDSQQIELSLLLLAKGMHSKFCMCKQEEKKNILFESIPYDQEIGVSCHFIPKQEELTEFYQKWQQIYFEKQKEKISYGIQLLIDQLYHYVTMYGVILYKELGPYSFYQFIKQLESDFKQIKTVHKTEKDQRLLEKIQTLFYQYSDILKHFDEVSDENCSSKYRALRTKLLELLKGQKNQEKEEKCKKILIFVDQKIISLYLHKLLLKQDIDNTYVVGTGNQTSGSLQMTILKEKNKVVSLNPSQNVLALAELIYNQFRIEGQERDIELDTEVNMDDQTAKIKLRSQLQEVLEGIKNYGKNLDQTVTSSKEQQESIKKFKGSVDVLVSTNVTEEGFDVPSCNYVFVFGEVSTLKQYVQKIGRARAEDSVVFFVLPQERAMFQKIKNEILKKSVQSVIQRIREINQNNYYKNIDNRIQELKIRIGQLQSVPPFYDSRLVKGSNALLTTNWAVEILSNYANLFKNYEYRENDENFIRGIFYQYTKFPALGYKCTLILPRNSSERYFIGDLLQNKEFAKKSAAFKAVIALRLKGILTDDLRPIKAAYSFVADKKNDPNMKDPKYYQVIEETVIIKTEPQLDLRQKMFPYLINAFEIDIELPLHLYRFKFYDLPNPIQRQLENEYNIGFIHNFKFCERLTFQGGKEIRLEYVKPVQLSKVDYQLLSQVHQFILATSFDLDIPYYQCQTGEKIDSDSALYQQKKTQSLQSIDQFKMFALLVFLIKDDDQYEIDMNISQKILNYQTKMKKVFSFINTIRYKKKQNQRIKEERIRLNDSSIRYQQWNPLEYDGELIKKMREQNFNGIVAQNISDRYHLSKVVLQSRKDINEVLQDCQSQEKKESLDQEYTQLKKVLKQIINFNFDQEKDVFAAPILRKYLKTHIAENRETIIKKQQKTPKYIYFAGEFYQFPIDLHICLQFRILVQYILLQLRDFLISFSFKKQTAQLFQPIQGIQTQIPKYNTMNSLIVKDSVNLIQFFRDNFIEFNDFVDRLKLNLDIQTQQLPQIQQIPLNFNRNYSIQDIDNELLNRCFQSQQYNQDDQTNYQVLEFLGDANLKLLASMEVFFLFPLANENLLHLERAKIVSNENLRKYAIILKFFQFIKCTKFPYFPSEFIQKDKEIEFEDQNEEKENDKKKNCIYLKNGEEMKNIPKNYQPIPEKVHSDVVEALNGAFFTQYQDVGACQFFLHKIGVLKYPTTKIDVRRSDTRKSQGLISDNLNKLQQILGYQFDDESLLVQAITHQSFLNTLDYYTFNKNNCSIVKFQDKQTKLNLNNIQANQLDQSFLNQLNELGSRCDMSYERLEFLGDSILDQVVVEWLVKEFTKDMVEDLALKKQCVVCNKALALVTLHYKLDQFLFHPNIHSKNHDQYITLNKIKLKYKDYYEDISLMYTQEPIIKILGDIFESLMGAIFVDTLFNYEQTKSVILKLLKPFMIHFTSPNQILKNPQDRLYRYFKSKNCQNFEFALTDEDPIDGQNLYVLRDKITLKVYQRIRASTEKHAREKVLEFIQRKGSLE